MRFLDLPDQELLLVVHALAEDDGSQIASNLRDLWNTANACKKMYAIVMKMMASSCTTRVISEESVLYSVVTTLSKDVIHGTLFALRAISSGKAVKTVESLRLCAMARHQLQTVLQRLKAFETLRTLTFVDVEGGVRVPDEVARRVQILSITRPRVPTLEALHEARCAPKRLKLCCVDDHTASALPKFWDGLTREAVKADVSWLGNLVPRYDKEFPGGWYLSDRQFENEMMQMRSGPRTVPYGPPYVSSMVHRNAPRHSFGFEAVRMSTWISEGMKTLSRSKVFFEDISLLAVEVDTPSVAKDLLQNDGTLMKQVVRQMMRDDADHSHGTLGFARLFVSMPLSDDEECAQLMVKAAAEVASSLAYAARVRVLLVNPYVFVGLKDVALPACVQSVGVLGDFALTHFVRWLPVTLPALAHCAYGTKQRSVWMQQMQLRDLSNDFCTETLLRRAEAACRRAEVEGLCAAGVRGMVEQWLHERTS